MALSSADLRLFGRRPRGAAISWPLSLEGPFGFVRAVGDIGDNGRFAHASARSAARHDRFARFSGKGLPHFQQIATGAMIAQTALHPEALVEPPAEIGKKILQKYPLQARKPVFVTKALR